MKTTQKEQQSEISLLKQAEFFLHSNKLSQAKNICSRLLTSPTQSAAACDMLAKICQAENNLEGVVNYWQQAINIAPFTKDYYISLGNILFRVRKYQEAIRVFEHGLKFLPYDGNMNNNLGCSYLELQQPDKAINYLCQAVLIEPYNENFIKNFLNASVSVNQTIPNENINKTLLSILSDAKLDRQVIVTLSLQNLRLNENIKWLLDNLKADADVSNFWENKVAKDNMLLAATSQVFVTLLSNITLMRGFDFEVTLTKIRNLFLNLILHKDFDKISLLEQKVIAEFCVALSHQAFLNNYLFKVTLAEEQLLTSLKQKIMEFDLSEQLSYEKIIAISIYSSYMKIYQDENIANKCNEVVSQPVKGFDFLIQRQLREPLTEKIYKKEITSLTDIDEKTTHVRAQYEEDPYPRWQTLEFASGYVSIPDRLKMAFPAQVKKLKPDLEVNKILIAGSGTGKHPICVALGNPQAQVTAVDISMSSLAYSTRKAKELNIRNINHYHADILNLPEKNLMFDAIESVGVLHHFVNPIDGFKSLIKILKPKGLFKIGLYSYTGRLDIHPTREYIKENKLKFSNENLHQLRDKIINSEDEKDKFLKERTDFFHLSTCRDLIFHSQETVYTIEDIIKLLDEVGLDFVGMEVMPAVSNLYHSKYPDDKGIETLEHWGEIEEENKTTFMNMYQFWAVKK